MVNVKLWENLVTWNYGCQISIFLNFFVLFLLDSDIARASHINNDKDDDDDDDTKMKKEMQ